MASGSGKRESIGREAQEAVPELVKLKDTDVFFKDFPEKALLQIKTQEKSN